MEKIVFVIDGTRVQDVLVGSYLNVVTVDHTDFMELMWKEDYRIRHNFMMLIGQWLMRLSAYGETGKYYEQIEGSIRLAQAVKPELMKKSLWPWIMFKDPAPNEVAVGVHDTESVERLFAAYLSKTEWEFCNPFHQFLAAMQVEDKTLQQTFTRFALKWCDWVVRNEVETDGEAYQIARFITSVPSVLLIT
ncbi:MAG: hypothetical protein Q4C91_00085 [Eubacteriales bacterium]|nr:hypothetical protein [Eubacteriales bacterium]